MNTYNGNNVTKAIKTLSAYTNGRFNLFSLAGNARTSCRAHVMADLLGLPKIAQSVEKLTPSQLQDLYFHYIAYRDLLCAGHAGMTVQEFHARYGLEHHPLLKA